MKNIVTRHFKELVSHQNEMGKSNEDMLTADVSVLAAHPQIAQAEEAPRPVKKRPAVVAQEQHDERVNVSRKHVEGVNASAKKLAINVDTFIRELRSSAEEVKDNPQLLKRMEQIRRLSVSFIRCLEHQLPGYATALFVDQKGS